MLPASALRVTEVFYLLNYSATWHCLLHDDHYRLPILVSGYRHQFLGDGAARYLPLHYTVEHGSTTVLPTVGPYRLHSCLYVHSFYDV